MNTYDVNTVETKESKKQFVNFRCKEFGARFKVKHKWFYEDNIYGESSCLILRENNTSEVVGSTAVFPRKLYINKKIIEAGITGDFGVSPEHRSLGPALKLQKATIQCCIDGKFDLLYGYANKKSAPVQKRAGFKLVGYPARYVRYISSYSLLLRYIKNRFLSKFISFFLDIIMKLFSYEIFSRRGLNYKFEVDIPVDEKFDRLWESAEKPALIVGKRDKQFVSWRFQQGDYKPYRLFTISEKNAQEMLGYIVFYEKETHVRIADVFCKNEFVFYDLINGFLNFAQKNKYYTVDLVYLGNVKFKSILEKCRFIRRVSDATFFVYLKNDDKFNNIPLNENSWYYLEGDGDS